MRPPSEDRCNAAATSSVTTAGFFLIGGALSMSHIKLKRSVPRCGLCGKTKNVIKTECCGNWICNDESKYVVFSYARNSCHRNHRRLTLCGYHFTEKHSDHWQECPDCLQSFEPEMTVWYGTNEYNFEILRKIPTFKPTYCDICGKRINLALDGCTRSRDEYWCLECAEKRRRSRR